ncbi:UNVERIFIED_CONTAM: hypothetical protein K2H54_051127 [Gekko kuhli]
MRLHYRHTLEHNSTSGNYRELDQILQGGGTARSQRVHKSFPLQTRPSTTSSQGTAESQAASPEEEFRLTMEPDEEQPEEEVLVPDKWGVLSMDPAYRAAATPTPHDTAPMCGRHLCWQSAGNTLQLSEEQGTGPEEDDETVVQEEPEPDMPPGAILAQLSPNSRMAVTRARRQRVSALQRMGECLLDQLDWHHEAMLATAQREHADYLEQMRLSQEEEQASRQPHVT